MEFMRLCRLCLTFSEYHANIFFDKIEDKQLWRVVNSVCELNTFLFDGLPEHICVDCLDTLKKTLSFKDRAIEATSTLKLMIQRNKDLLPTEDEIDIEEWQMPKELKTESMDTEDYGIQSELNIIRNIDNVDDGSASTEVWEKLDALKSSKATPKVVQVETPEGTKEVVQPAVSPPPSTRSTTKNKVSGVGSVLDASPKNKRLRSSGKSSQRKSTPPSPGRTRTMEVETPSCDNSKQGPSSEKDPMLQSLSEHQSGAEKKVERPFVCQQCGASYVRKHFLQKHEVAHRNEWTCTTCGQHLPSKRDLNSHMQFHSHVRPSSARSSDLKNSPSLEVSEETAGVSKSILNDTESISHLKAPLSKSTFVCDICKRSFKRKENLRVHVRVHNSERPFSCNVCNKLFKQETARHRHQLRHIRDKLSLGKSEEGNKKKPFSCTVCGNNFSTKRGLCRHSNVHSDRYKCNSCGRCFTHNSSLIRHSKTHTKEKPFKCKVCSKCFSRKFSLNIHLGLHSSDKPFACDTCGKRFKTNNYKVNHELFHLRKK